MIKDKCYCDSQKPYKTCCQPFLSGHSLPDTPKQLMRSRFSAFCTGNVDYLFETHHPSARQPNEKKMLNQTIEDTQWVGLKIIKSEKPASGAIKGFVEFIAFYQNNNIEQLHENSKFIYEGNRWYYLDGSILKPHKFKQNEPCWCGSQKKFKRCHGKTSA